MSTSTETTLPVTENTILITRKFNAPRQLVFDAWSKPEHLLKWFSPNGCSNPECTVDFRVGGRFHICMRTPGGDMWVLGVYQEIVVPERIVYRDTMSDKEGNVRAPQDFGMSEDFPKETLITITFEEKDGVTTMTLRNDLPTSFKERAEMEEGWNEMFDKMASVVDAH